MTSTDGGRQVFWVGLVITDGCNFRCGMCDYWKTRRPKMLTPECLQPLVHLLVVRGLQGVTITGGEPFMNKDWAQIARLFHPHARVNISTNGSAILSNAPLIGEMVDKVIVSIDGASAETFHRIRGVDMLDKIWSDLETLKARYPRVKTCVKLTIQRENVFETREFLEQALRRTWLDGVGFGIPDFSMEAFALRGTELPQYTRRVLPDARDLPRIRVLFEELVEDHRALFEDGYVFEGDLLRYISRFESLADKGPAPTRNCLIPREVLTIHADERVSGCFFLPADSSVSELVSDEGQALDALLNRRATFDSPGNPTCQRCDQLLFTNSRFEVTIEGKALS